MCVGEGVKGREGGMRVEDVEELREGVKVSEWGGVVFMKAWRDA